MPTVPSCCTVLPTTCGVNKPAQLMLASCLLSCANPAAAENDSSAKDNKIFFIRFVNLSPAKSTAGATPLGLVDLKYGGPGVHFAIVPAGGYFHSYRSRCLDAPSFFSSYRNGVH